MVSMGLSTMIFIKKFLLELYLTLIGLLPVRCKEEVETQGFLAMP
jgi:hypothetical protein